MDIHRSSLGDYILPKMKSVYVIDYYEGIKSVLDSRTDFPFDGFLGNPRLRTRTEIVWSTDVFYNRPAPLSSLHGEERKQYAHLLWKRVYEIECLIQTLKAEEGGGPLSELLEKSISSISEEDVYCSDDKVVVVNWGLIPRRTNPAEGRVIYKGGRFINEWETISMLASQTISASRNTQDEAAVSLVEAEEVVVTSMAAGQYEESQDVLQGDTSTGDVQLVIEQTSSMVNDVAEISTYGEGSIAENVSNQEEDMPISASAEAIAKDDATSLCSKESGRKHQQPDCEEKRYGWNTLFTQFGQGVCFLLRKLLWPMLLMLLLLLTLYLCRGCQGPIHRINPFYSPLPKEPIILPVDDSAIGKSEDGMKMIATDRLNVLLELKDGDTMSEWAKAFKRVYPGNEYEVVYYNRELDHLQIRVPTEEREKIKSALPSQLPEFSFDVFDEQLQGGNVELNDPVLTDERLSWYLKPIGTYDAWNMTMGSSDVVIAIVDNGFDLNHEELVGKLVRPYNVLSKNDHLRPIVTKYGINSHGTHVAATAAGKGNNGKGLLGIAPDCKLMLVQVGGDNADGYMTNTAVREGVLYAINQGAHVVNISLGLVLSDDLKFMTEAQQLNYISYSDKEDELIWGKIYQKAKDKNCTIVLAAGNENVIAGMDFKKRHDNTIRVSALNPNLSKASFSNYGVYPELKREYSTVSAPGVFIYNAAPGNCYETNDGTSMAAPIVTGAVALLKSIDRNLTNSQIISILKKTGVKVGDNIGSMIRVDAAVRYVNGDTLPVDPCEHIKEEILLLESQLDSLKRLCPDAAMPADTLKYADAVKDKHGLDGLWKATTKLVNEQDRTPIELFFSFRKLKGNLVIINKGKAYQAPLTAKIKDGKIYIVQHAEARSNDGGSESYNIYDYVCVPDRKGNMQCSATLDSSKVVFNLIKVTNK